MDAPTHHDADASGNVTLNDILSYSATATNNGNVPLSAMTLTDLLVDTTGHDCGDLDTNDECLLTGAYTVTQADVDAGKVTNTVTAAATELSAPITATQETTVYQEKALTLHISAVSPSFDAVGGPIHYDYAVTNSGTVTLSGTLTITDDKLTSSGITCPAIESEGLAPAASVTCRGTYTVVQADVDMTSVTNTASASLDEVTSNEATLTVRWVSSQTNKPVVSIGNAPVGEGAGTVEMTATLSESSAQNVTVEYATSDETAVAGTDYTTANGMLTFSPSETTRPITITVLDDEDDDAVEQKTFTVTLSNPTNATLSSYPTGTVTITDDDPSVDVRFEQASYNVDERMEQGSNIHWRITVRPDSNSEVSIVLPVTTDCDGQGTICTEDGRELSNRNELTVSGPGG